MHEVGTKPGLREFNLQLDAGDQILPHITDVTVDSTVEFYLFALFNPVPSSKTCTLHRQR